MKAKDTVLSDPEIKKAMSGAVYINFADVKGVAKAQAEISFNMGYNQALKDKEWGIESL